MTAFEQRVLSALGNDVQKSPWEQLISLFQADQETFYRLACEGVTQQAEARLRELADLAGRVRAAIQESYEIEPVSGGANLASFSGKKAFIPAELVQRVDRFLHEIDGKMTATTPGRDYEGEEVSEAEAYFKLGDRNSWTAERAQLEEERQGKPMVLRLSPDELSDLATQPPYVTYELLYCARRTVLAPTSVFRGLKRGGGPTKVDNGWAFCGKPRQAYRNDGTPFPAPEGMVHMVYADEDGYVFDWDWVRENPDEPGYPLDWQLRFDAPYQLKVDSALYLPKDLRPGHFDPKVACYSNRGDCLFCYMTDDVSYADRINADLTVFKTLDGDKITGFKVKNVRRILEVDQRIVIKDAPGITVSVESILLVSRELHPEASVDIYAILIALRQSVGDPPKVHVPPPPTELVKV